MLFCYTSLHFIHSFSPFLFLSVALSIALSNHFIINQLGGKNVLNSSLFFYRIINEWWWFLWLVRVWIVEAERSEPERQEFIIMNRSETASFAQIITYSFVMNILCAYQRKTHARTHESTHTYNNQINGARASRSKWIYWISDMPDIDINPNVTSIPSLLPPFCLSICFCVFVFQFRLNRMIWLQKHCPLSWRNSFVSNLAHTHT